MVICSLSIHDDNFSAAHAVFNTSNVPDADFAFGDVLIVQPEAGGKDELSINANKNANQEDHGLRPTPRSGSAEQDDAFVFVFREIDADTKAKSPKMQLSVSQRIAELFHLTKNANVFVSVADKTRHTATHVEVSFKDVYLTRADMLRMTSSVMLNNVIYLGEKMSYLGSVQFNIGGIYIHGKRRRAAYFAASTKPVFRSEAARFIIYIQMSQEMWDPDTDGNGEICFNKVVNGLLPQLFKKWSRRHLHHLVSIVFFTRVRYDPEQESEQAGTNLRATENAFQDFYRVAIGEMSSGEWSVILQQLNKEFSTFLNEILVCKRAANTKFSPSYPDMFGCDILNINGRLCPARTGNILEAINTASSPFSKDWIDTDLFRTGLSIVVISPGAGVFDVDESLIRLTTENLVNNGINIDLICLSRAPLHSVPLFRYSIANNADEGGISGVTSIARMDHAFDPLENPNSFSLSRSPPNLLQDVSRVSKLGEVKQRACVIPQWMHVHFWHAGTQTPMDNSQGASGHSYRAGSSMRGVRTNGIMESEMHDVTIPCLELTRPEPLTLQNQVGIEMESIEPDLWNGATKTQHDFLNTARHNISRDALHVWKDLQSYDKEQFGSKISNTMNKVAVFRRDLSTDLRSRRASRADSLIDDQLNGIASTTPLTRPNLLRRLSSQRKSPTRQRKRLTMWAENEGEEVTKNNPPRPTPPSHNDPKRERRQASSLLATSKGLSLGKAAASTITQQNSAQSVQAQVTPLNVTSHKDSDSKSVSSLSQQVRTSLARSQVETNSGTASPISSRDLNIQTAPQNIPKEQDPNEASRIDSFGSGELKTIGNSFSRRSAKHMMEKRPLIERRQSSNFEVKLPPSMAPWLTVVNPAKPLQNLIVDHGWAHAFVRKSQMHPLRMKWESLCSPAILPLTSDYLVTPDILAGLVERPHRITIDEDDIIISLESTRAKLMSELISFRLAKGFQIVKSSTASLSHPFDKESLAKDGCSIYLMKGNFIHVLCSAGSDIQITRYQPGMFTPDHQQEETPYEALIRSTLEPTYEKVTTSLTLARDQWNWSIIDNYLAGHIENFPEATGYWRTRFVLIPIQPGRYARRLFKAPNDDTDDELRIDGIQRLTQIWHRARVRDDADDSVSDLKWRKEIDPNPLGLEFQTRDASVVLSTGLEDSRLFQGQSFVASTQLFSAEDKFRTSNFDLKELASALQGEKGIESKDRRWYVTIHRHAFVGADLTSWLQQQFQDISSREEAETFGRKLMDLGLFKHVRGAHKFRDGNFFYSFTDEYLSDKQKTPVLAAQRSNKVAMPIVASLEKMVESPRSVISNPMENKQTMLRNIDRSVKKPRIYLSAVLRCDLDPRGKSQRDESVKLHYDRLFNPEACFHFRLEWMSTTAKLVEEAVSAWSNLAERHGLKLVEAPIAEASKVADINPFRTPSCITLAAAPPEAELGSQYVDKSASEPLPTHRYHPYQRALLKKFGFVLDQEAGENFPADVDVKYTYAHESYTYSQYIHKTGIVLAQVDTCGRILLVANRLANNRAGFYREVVTKRDEEKSGPSESRPGTGMMARSQLLSSPVAYPMSPGKASPVTELPQRDRVSQGSAMTAEQVKEEFEKFCNDSDALLAFYEEVSRHDPILSPRSTPAMGPTHINSSRSTPLLQATIPALELPPISVIAQMPLRAPAPSSGAPDTSTKAEGHDRPPR